VKYRSLKKNYTETIQIQKDTSIKRIERVYSFEELKKLAALPLRFHKSPASLQEIQNQIENYDVFIESKIKEVEDETEMIIDKAKLFHDVSLDLTVRDYLKAILSKIDEDGDDICQLYAFIRDFLDFLSPSFEYDKYLTKTLVTGGRKKTRYKKKNNGSRLNAKKSKKLRK